MNKSEDIYTIELRCEWGWIKQETAYTSYEKAEQACEDVGLERNQYRIIRCKEKKRKNFSEIFKNLFTF